MKILFLLVMNFIALQLYAQPAQVRFNARALLDMSVSRYNPEQKTRLLYSVEDLRLGVIARHKQFEFKIDIGIGAEEIAIKDLMFNYHFEGSFISVGNTLEPFSMEMLTSTIDMFQHQGATSALAFGNSRKLGVSYVLDHSGVYFATGVYTDNDINAILGERSDRYIATMRMILRPRVGENGLLHIGGAYSFRTAANQPDGEISATGVSSMLGHDLLGAVIPNQGSGHKVGAEFLFQHTRWRIQMECFGGWVSSGEGLYRPFGGYLQSSYLLLGRGFDYDSQYAVPSRPTSLMALELNFRYNYTNLNDSSAGIYGGEQHDFSVGLNYYINRRFALKANCTYLLLGDSCNSFYEDDLFLVQFRFQCRL